MKLYTIGYGGRQRDEFIDLVRQHDIRTVVDVRLRPDRASMGIWVKAKTSDKGIEKWLKDAGIEYLSLIELGNLFLEFTDWQDRYRQLLEQAGSLLIGRLVGLSEPYCLLCAEKRVAECHRFQIAEYLARTRGVQVHHLE